MTDPYSAVVLQMDRSHVDTVLVAGAVHRIGGRGVHDDHALVERAGRVAGRLAAAGLVPALG